MQTKQMMAYCCSSFNEDMFGGIYEIIRDKYEKWWLLLYYYYYWILVGSSIVSVVHYHRYLLLPITIHFIPIYPIPSLTQYHHIHQPYTTIYPITLYLSYKMYILLMFIDVANMIMGGILVFSLLVGYDDIMMGLFT